MTLLLSSTRLVSGSTSPASMIRRQRSCLLIILSIILIIASSLSLGNVTYRGELNDVLLFLLIMYACAVLAGMRGMVMLEQILKLSCLVLTIDMVTPIASAALASISLPLCDGYLVQVDSFVFGKSLWPSITLLYRSYPTIIRLLSYAYASITWQPFFLILLLCSLKYYNNAWDYVMAWGLSLLICVIVFPFCPALGAYAYFHITPSDVPDVLVRSAWQYPEVLQKFRTGQLHDLDTNALEGIIAMPSFHACASVLLGWGFMKVRILAPFFIVLNTFMWTSSIPIGGHYGVDILCGSVVAMTSIVIISVMSRTESCSSA